MKKINKKKKKKAKTILNLIFVIKRQNKKMLPPFCFFITKS